MKIVSSLGTVVDNFKEAGENRKKLPTEAMFKGKKGYWQKPAKVWRTGVGWVDGYKWGCRAPKKPKRGEVHAMAVHESMQDFNRAEARRQAELQRHHPKEVMRSQDGRLQYVAPEIAQLTAKRNGWHSPGRIVGLLARDVCGDFCSRCDRRRSWCECKAGA